MPLDTVPTTELLALEIKHLRELLQVKEEALKLQATEYERRLASLNHEAEQLKSMQNTYIPREVFDRTVESMTGRIGAVEKSLWRISGALTIAWVIVQFLQKYKFF
jgi:FtsZ-binding cell division protein ZapB